MLTQEQALIPTWIHSRGNSWLENVLVVLGGVVLMTALSQISIPLPWTVVPITGQTFGVAVMALLWGRKRGAASILSYLALGASGIPVFALGKAGLVWGPTFGYLIGMGLSAFCMGWLADRGWARGFLSAWMATLLGSALTFACGLFVLSYFVPRDQLLMAGMIPFLPGDLIKNITVATLVSRTSQQLIRK